MDKMDENVRVYMEFLVYFCCSTILDMKTSLTTKRVAVLLTMLLTILNGFAQGMLNYSVAGLQADDRTVVSLGLI